MTPVFTASNSGSDIFLDEFPTVAVLYEARHDERGKLVDFRLLHLNKAALLAWQRPETDLIGRPVSQLFPEADADFLIQQFSVVFKTGRAVRFSMTLSSGNGAAQPGAIIDYDVSVSKLENCVLLTCGNVAEEEKNHRIEFLKTVLDNAQTAISAFDVVRDETQTVVDFRYTMANQQAIGQSGFAESELMGHTLTELFPNIRQSEVFDHWLAIVATQQPRQFELHYPYDGFDTWTLCSGAPFGKDGLVISYTDITAQKRAETQARQQADLLESIQNTTQIGISAYRAIRDDTGAITDFMPVFRNAESARLAGQPAGLVADTTATLLEQIPSVKTTGLFDRHVRVVETGQGEQVEQQYNANGIEGYFTLSIQPWTDGFVASVVDTTELRRIEREKIRQSDFYKSVLDNTLASISAFDAVRDETGTITDFRFTLANKEAVRLSGLTEADLIGNKLTELFPGVRESGQFANNARIIESGQAQQLEVHYDYEGYDVWLLASSAPHGDTLLVSYIDITAQKQAEQQAKQQTELLESIQNATQVSVSAYKAIRDDGGDIINFKPVFRNQASARMTNQPAGQIPESDMMTLLDVAPAVMESGIFDRYVQVTNTGQAVHFEYQEGADGQETWFDLSVAPWNDGFVVSVLNTTELRRAERDKSAQADFYKTVLDNTTASISVLDAVRDETGTITDFRFALANKEAVRQSGLTEKDLIGNKLTELFPGVRESGLFANNVSIVESGQAQQREVHYDYGSHAVWMLASSAPYGDTLLASYVDITAQKRAELLLQGQNELLMRVVENGKAGMTLFSLIRDETGAITDFRYVFTNAVNARNTGRSVADMTGNTLLTLLPGVAQTEWYGRLMNTAITGQSESFLFGYEAENIRGWFDTLFVKIGDDQVLFTDLNVKPLKDAEVALQNQNRLLQEVVDSTQVGLLLIEPIRDEARQITDFRYLLTNDYNARMGGKQVADLTGEVVGDVFAGWQDSDLFRRLVAVAETGQPQRLTFPYEGYGYSGWFDGSFTAINGCVLYTYTDVTPLKNAEVAAQKNADLLAVKNRELKRSNENLKSFAYIASHDLQEPLRKLTSFAGILNTQYAGQLDAGAADIVQRMNTAAERMRLLIQDLLTYSRVETKPGSHKPVDLTVLIEELRENELWAALRQSKATLEIGTLPMPVADPSQMQQLFQNLLSNAIKFSRPGVVPMVTISSRLITRADIPEGVLSPAKAGESTPSGNDFYEIAVSDNGISFEEKYTEQIFQVFQRLHGRSQYVGSGIGLAICRKISERHEGAITATSEPGRGSTFRVYLPVRE